MEQFELAEVVERYLTGEMGPDEKHAFEEMRKNNPEIGSNSSRIPLFS